MMHLTYDAVLARFALEKPRECIMEGCSQCLLYWKCSWVILDNDSSFSEIVWLLSEIRKAVFISYL